MPFHPVCHFYEFRYSCVGVVAAQIILASIDKLTPYRKMREKFFDTWYSHAEIEHLNPFAVFFLLVLNLIITLPSMSSMLTSLVPQYLNNTIHIVYLGFDMNWSFPLTYFAAHWHGMFLLLVLRFLFQCNITNYTSFTLKYWLTAFTKESKAVTASLIFFYL